MSKPLVIETIQVIQGSGRDCLIARTNYPNPIPAVLDADRRLPLQMYCPHGEGAMYAEKHFPDAVITIVGELA